MLNRQTLGILALAFVMSAGTVELDPTVAANLSTETITLHGKMKADVAYNVICEAAGIDVIFDPSFEPPQMWLKFNDITLGQALEIVRGQSRTAWHPVAPHMIAVVPVPPPKIEYR
jgi:hypothetical protein